MPLQVAKVKNAVRRELPKFGIIGILNPIETVLELRGGLALTGGANTIEIQLHKCRIGTSGQHIMASELAQVITDYFSRPGSKPIILTDPIIKDKNGVCDISIKDQVNFWLDLPDILVDIINDPQKLIYVDMDLNLIRQVAKLSRQQIFPWEKVIVSQHYTANTPQDSELRQILCEMETTKALAGIVLTTLAKDEGDVVQLERLYKNRTDKRPLIAFAKGEAGQSSQIECLTTWGGAGTYAYIGGRGKSTNGMLTVEEMSEIPRVREALGRKKK